MTGDVGCWHEQWAVSGEQWADKKTFSIVIFHFSFFIGKTKNRQVVKSAKDAKRMGCTWQDGGNHQTISALLNGIGFLGDLAVLGDLAASLFQ